MMKVLLINGSPRERGNTRAALDVGATPVEIKEAIYQCAPYVGLERARCALEEVNAACAKTGRCVLEGGVNEAVEALAAADGLIVGTPVHYASPAGALLAFLDRMFYAGAERFAHKPAAAFACARRAGTTASLDVINKYFTISQMPVVSSTYWSQIYGGAPGDASHDAEGLQTARNLARNMAWLLKCIAAGPEPPEAETAARTNFIR